MDNMSIDEIANLFELETQRRMWIKDESSVEMTDELKNYIEEERKKFLASIDPRPYIPEDNPYDYRYKRKANRFLIDQ